MILKVNILHKIIKRILFVISFFFFFFFFLCSYFCLVLTNVFIYYRRLFEIPCMIERLSKTVKELLCKLVGKYGSVG